MAKWNIDSDHTVAAFKVRHFMITLVRGQFNKISGTIQFDPEHPALGSVEVSIDAGGIYTGIPKRDEHLRSPDFLDGERFPLIQFKSNAIDPVAVNHFKVRGELTIRGLSKPVTLDVEYLGRVKSPFDEDVSIGFSASTRLNRQDFGVSWNFNMENGGRVVGDDLFLQLEVEADLVQE
ncbi:MAG: polyisoprenoid-binding protein [Desulfobacca sp.]|nr:polyisoprenoid-binding protein [Desulfobacca sp.]